MKIYNRNHKITAIMLISIFVFLLAVPISQSQKVLCSDSDEADIYNKGRTAGQEPYIFQDFCLGNKVVEATCVNNKQTYLLFDCSKGCSDGACKFSSQNQPCSQQDGSVSVSGKTYFDKCVKSESGVPFDDSMVKYSCLTETAIVSRSNIGTRDISATLLREMPMLSRATPASILSSTIESCGDKICSTESGKPACTNPTIDQLPAGMNPTDNSFSCKKEGNTTLFNKALYTDTCDNFDSKLGYLTKIIRYRCSSDEKLIREEVDCNQLGKKCVDSSCVTIDNSNEKTNYLAGEIMPEGIVLFLSFIGIFILIVVILITMNLSKPISSSPKRN